ncbi:hypothetical protein [Wenzhouxiangella sp. EGI_FJ10409]|uniref:hypothetical protein n=1 Tax=Wenzhouxiangella sp. EGI_FJ10409 TaxID=3243767 RepID=UPI0035DBC541
MSISLRSATAWSFALLLLWATNAGAETAAEAVDRYLSTASVAEGVEALSGEVEAHPDDAERRLALGFLQFTAAIERLGQSWYRYGLRSRSDFASMMPFLRLPIPDNPEPEPIAYEDGRAVFERMLADFARAEATLAAIDDPGVALDIHPGRGYLDFNDDGEAQEDEALWRILATVNRGSGLDAETAAQFRIRLDSADVHWLRGYTHLLSALLEFYLSHDGKRLFDHTAHLYFERPDTPYPFLAELQVDGGMTSMFFDAIALIHLIDLPVVEPDRRARAVAHLEAVIAQSRQSWQAIREETDDEREWVPGPQQTGVIPGANVTEAMVEQWLAFLDETESILAGDTLVPFWRGQEPIGINLRRALLESERFDLVLWLQGSGAAPFFEDGPITEAAFWRELRGTFNGRFLGFALWFN